MKSLVCKNPGKLEFNNSESTILKKDHAIIKLKRIGICGTDLHASEGTHPFFNYSWMIKNYSSKFYKNAE